MSSDPLPSPAAPNHELRARWDAAAPRPKPASDELGYGYVRFRDGFPIACDRDALIEACIRGEAGLVWTPDTDAAVPLGQVPEIVDEMLAAERHDPWTGTRYRAWAAAVAVVALPAMAWADHNRPLFQEFLPIALAVAGPAALILWQAHAREPVRDVPPREDGWAGVPSLVTRAAIGLGALAFPFTFAYAPILHLPDLPVGADWLLLGGPLLATRVGTGIVATMAGLGLAHRGDAYAPSAWLPVAFAAGAAAAFAAGSGVPVGIAAGVLGMAGFVAVAAVRGGAFRRVTLDTDVLNPLWAAGVLAAASVMAGEVSGLAALAAGTALGLAAGRKEAHPAKKKGIGGWMRDALGWAAAAGLIVAAVASWLALG